MNMRYWPLGLGAIALLSLAVSIYTLVDVALRPLAKPPGPLPPLPALEEEARAALALAPRVEAALVRWERTDPVPLSRSAPVIAQAVAGGASAESPTMPQRQLLLVLQGPDDAGLVALLDGRLVRSGERLEQGGRVLRIETDRVELAERLGRQTLTLPRDSVRVGTVRWPDGRPASVATRDYAVTQHGTAQRIDQEK